MAALAKRRTAVHRPAKRRASTVYGPAVSSPVMIIDGNLRPFHRRLRSLFRPPAVRANAARPTGISSSQRRASFRAPTGSVGRRCAIDVPGQCFSRNRGDTRLWNARLPGGRPVAKRRSPGPVFRQSAECAGGLGPDRPVKSSCRLGKDTGINSAIGRQMANDRHPPFIG